MEVMGHKFNFGFKDISDHMKPLRDCATERNETSVKTCTSSHLGKMCPQRFNTNPAKSYHCYQLLNDEAYLKKNAADKEKKAVKEYRKCLAEKREVLTPCIENLRDFCSSKKVHVVKAVRGRMMYVKALIDKIPDLHVIHMYRDPRPVAPSRKAYGVMSLYSEKNFVRESELYCRQVHEDIVLRKQLELQYPGQFMEIVFEDLASNALDISKNVMDFIGLEWDLGLEQWILENTQAKRATSGVRRNSTKHIDKWQKKMTADVLAGINEVCTDLYSVAGHKWPMTVVD